AFVGDAVAIVVDAVADFRNGTDRALADDASADARREPGATAAEVHPTRRTGARVAVVDHAVAIIVATVAGLGQRRARTRAPRRRRAIGIGAVGATIAIVVQAVRTQRVGVLGTGRPRDGVAACRRAGTGRTDAAHGVRRAHERTGTRADAD